MGTIHSLSYLVVVKPGNRHWLTKHSAYGFMFGQPVAIPWSDPTKHSSSWIQLSTRTTMCYSKDLQRIDWLTMFTNFANFCLLKVDFVVLPVKNRPNVLKMYLLCPKPIPGASTLAMCTHFLPKLLHDVTFSRLATLLRCHFHLF